MKASYIWLLCVVGLLTIFAISVPAQEPESIEIVFFYGGYAPFYMEGLEEGIYIDFIKAFDQQSPEFTITLTPLSRKRIDDAMDQGEIQASGLTNPMFVAEQQAANTLFTKPIWTSGNYIVLHENNVFDYSAPEDLFGKTLGVIYGNKNVGLDLHIEAGEIKALPVRTNEGLYKALMENKVDAIIMNKHVLLYELKLQGIEPSQFIFSDTAVSEFELMTQVQKTHQHFRDKLDAFIDQSKQNGFLDEVAKKYLE